MNWRSLDWVMNTTGTAVRIGSRIGMKAVPVALFGVMALVAAQSLPACSTSNPATEISTNGSGTGTGGTSATTGSTQVCDHPNPGCPCSGTGQTGDCGKVIYQSGDFFQCSEGTTTCDGTTWGACTGDLTVQGRRIITGPGVSLQGYGTPSACGAVNACDPYCVNVVDTGPGIDGGTTIAAADAGLTIAYSTAPTCNVPTSATGVIANDFASTGAGPFVYSKTAAYQCSGAGTAADSCPFDSYCSLATAGTCTAYAAGGNNTSCTTTPDFTLGVGCWDDGSAMDGLELEVCNRGGVAAATSTLYVDLTDAPPTGAVQGTGCNATYAFADQLLAVAPAANGAQCAIPLATSPLGVGQCLSFNIFHPTAASGITCKSNATSTTLSTTNFAIMNTSHIAAVVNPAAASGFAPSHAAIAECDVCNNYSTFSASAAGQTYAECTSGSCATVGTVIPPNICNEPATGATVLLNDVTSPNSNTFLNGHTLGNTSLACVGGGTTTDDCPFDYKCSAVSAGTCAPYTQGTTNSACSSTPDFTLGLGCWDSTVTPLLPLIAGLNLEVCNRGGVTAATNTLQIDLTTTAPPASPGGVSTGCPTGVGGTWPDLAPLATSANGAYCKIALGTAPIAPGECLAFNPFNPPSGITCFAANSTTPLTTATFSGLNSGSQIAAVVNPSASSAFLPAATPLAECDTCNNYATISANSTLMANAAYAPATCTASLCGLAGGSGGSACVTSITGKVMDPGGNVGLPNVEVYVPTGTVLTFADPPQGIGTAETPYCDTCAGLSSPGYTSGTLTGIDGSFTLQYTGTAMSNVPIIAQLGRWRRQAVLSTVTQCSTTANAITAGSLDMPNCRTGSSNCGATTKKYGDIPRMALVMGDREALECWLLKIGIDSSEITPWTGAANPTRVHLYRTSGENGSSTPLSGAALWDNVPPAATTGTLLNYSSVMLPCDSGDVTPTTAEQNALVSYANGGGRVFMDHRTGDEWLGAGNGTIWDSNTNISQWQGNTSVSGTPAYGKIQNTTPFQQNFYSWLTTTANGYNSLVNSANGIGYLKSLSPYADANGSIPLGLDIMELIRGESGNNWSGDPNGDYALSFLFNTPLSAGSAGAACGRVIYNGMHVSQTRASGTYPFTTSNTFPTQCDQTTILSPEELALEYEFFQLNACDLQSTQTASLPSPPVPLQPTTFIRTYQAMCESFTPVWGYFEWEANVPPGTSITFRALTAPDATTGGPGTYGPAVTLGSATTTSTTWAMTGTSVDAALTAAMPMQSSQDYLQIEMTLNPNAAGTLAPTVNTWRQLYDCKP